MFSEVICSQYWCRVNHCHFFIIIFCSLERLIVTVSLVHYRFGLVVEILTITSVGEPEPRKKKISGSGAGGKKKFFWLRDTVHHFGSFLMT